MTVLELQKLLNNQEPITLLDVREPYEWEIATIPGTTHQIPLKWVQDRASEIDTSTPCVVYCRSGKRSQLAIELLQEKGLLHLVNLEGGILAWSEHIDPSMDTY